METSKCLRDKGISWQVYGLRDTHTVKENQLPQIVFCSFHTWHTCHNACTCVHEHMHIHTRVNKMPYIYGICSGLPEQECLQGILLKGGVTYQMTFPNSALKKSRGCCSCGPGDSELDGGIHLVLFLQLYRRQEWRGHVGLCQGSRKLLKSENVSRIVFPDFSS